MWIQILALDGPRLDDISGQDLQAGFGAERQAETLHPTEVLALLVPHRGKRRGQRAGIPAELGPLWVLMDVGHIRRTWRVDCSRLGLAMLAFTAQFAAKGAAIRRRQVFPPDAPRNHDTEHQVPR